MDWKKYLKKTDFAQDTDKIVNAFRVAKVVTYRDLENLPVKLGAHVGEYSTFQLREQLIEVIDAEESAEVPPVPAAATASVEDEPAKAEKGTEQEQQTENKAPAKKRTGRRAPAGTSGEKAEQARSYPPLEEEI